MITLIGTGHVFDISSALLEIFDEKEPDVICVELDKRRYNAIMMKRKKRGSFEKDLPFIYRLLARFQENMAREYGVSAGDEMLAAIEYAQSHQIQLEFIDMNTQRLFTKMWASMPFREKMRLILTGFGALFVSKKRVEEELRNFEENYELYIEKIGEKFPTIKKTLIDKRNMYMVKRLVELNEEYQKIVACVGDGHVPGISEMLSSKNIEFETIRLNELRKIRDTDSSYAHFSVSLGKEY
jgi:pheromone shutdown-related protein TraB